MAVNYFAFGLIILDGHYPDVGILPASSYSQRDVCIYEDNAIDGVFSLLALQRMYL
jgi:hypothetical protein